MLTLLTLHLVVNERESGVVGSQVHSIITSSPGSMLPLGKFLNLSGCPYSDLSPLSPLSMRITFQHYAPER